MVKLWYYMKGMEEIFPITLQLTDTIYDAKKRIYEEGRMRELSPHILELRKVSYIKMFM